MDLDVVKKTRRKGRVLWKFSFFHTVFELPILELFSIIYLLVEV